MVIEVDGLHSTQLSPIKADWHQSHQSRPQTTDDDADDHYNGDNKLKLISHIKVVHKMLMMGKF